jgi:hypothetical protein
VLRITRAAAALGVSVPRLSSRRVRYILALVMLVTTLQSGSALAAGTLTSTSVSLSDPRPSATGVSYTFAGSSVDTSTAMLCVQVVWSTTVGGDTAPAGFDGSAGSVDASSSTLIGSSATNWTLARSDGTSSIGKNNIFHYTNSSSGYTPSSSPRTFVLAGVTNPSTANTDYYLTLNTFSDLGCSAPIDNATVGFVNTVGSTVSLNVDPSLTFSVKSVSSGQSCAGGTTTQGTSPTSLDFGHVTTATNGLVCQDLQAATNASSGYTVYARYTGQLTNGAQSFADVAPGTNSVPDAFPGGHTEAYGYTTDDQSLSTCSGGCAANRFFDGLTYQWAAMTTFNAEVGYEGTGGASATYRIGHQVSLSTTTPPGIYTTTIIYSCTPTY